tara:strand:- start:1953 stop:2186 length:234 start_codon:yes stop_codon:yes gene_type:complete
MTKPSIFSFFSGAGFLDLGFETDGYDVCYVNEYHVPFLDAYKHSRRVMGIPYRATVMTTPALNTSIQRLLLKMCLLR